MGFSSMYLLVSKRFLYPPAPRVWSPGLHFVSWLPLFSLLPTPSSCGQSNFPDILPAILQEAFVSVGVDGRKACVLPFLSAPALQRSCWEFTLVPPFPMVIFEAQRRWHLPLDTHAWLLFPLCISCITSVASTTARLGLYAGVHTHAQHHAQQETRLAAGASFIWSSFSVPGAMSAITVCWANGYRKGWWWWCLCPSIRLGPFFSWFSLFLVFWDLITEIEVIRNFKHILPYNPTSTPTKFYAASLVLQVQNDKLFAIPNC